MVKSVSLLRSHLCLPHVTVAQNQLQTLKLIKSYWDHLSKIVIVVVGLILPVILLAVMNTTGLNQTLGKSLTFDLKCFKNDRFDFPGVSDLTP